MNCSSLSTLGTLSHIFLDCRLLQLLRSVTNELKVKKSTSLQEKIIIDAKWASDELFDCSHSVNQSPSTVHKRLQANFFEATVATKRQNIPLSNLSITMICFFFH